MLTWRGACPGHEHHIQVVALIPHAGRGSGAWPMAGRLQPPAAATQSPTKAEHRLHAAQAAVRAGLVDMVGLGRMVLSYPDYPADALAGRPLERTRICRTFSDCTTAPRHGLKSGCYPLDDYYKSLEPEAARVKAIKAAAGAG